MALYREGVLAYVYQLMWAVLSLLLFCTTVAYDVAIPANAEPSTRASSCFRIPTAHALHGRYAKKNIIHGIFAYRDACYIGIPGPITPRSTITFCCGGG